MTNITNIQVFPTKGKAGKIKANLSFTVDNTVYIKARVVEGTKGPFVSLPQSSYVNKETGKTEYKDEAGFTSPEVAKSVSDILLAAYTARMKQPMTTTSATTGTNGKKGASDLPF